MSQMYDWKMGSYNRIHFTSRSHGWGTTTYPRRCRTDQPLLLSTRQVRAVCSHPARVDASLTPGLLESALKGTQGVAPRTSGVSNSRGLLLHHFLESTPGIGPQTPGSRWGRPTGVNSGEHPHALTPPSLGGEIPFLLSINRICSHEDPDNAQTTTLPTGASGKPG